MSINLPYGIFFLLLQKSLLEPWLKSSPISHLVFLSRLLNTYDRLFYWAILWRLIEALGLQRVEFLSDPWVILAKTLSFLDFDNVFSISVQMEQKQQEITLLMEFFKNKSDFKSVIPKKNSNFPILFLEFFCWNLKLPPTGWVFLPKIGLEFVWGWPWVFWKRTKKMPGLRGHTLSTTATKGGGGVGDLQSV